MAIIKKGAITNIEQSESAIYADIEVSRNEIIRAMLLFPYGDVSKIKVDGSSVALVIYPSMSMNKPMAIPFNIPLQPSDLADGEKTVGNFDVGNRITFKENGDVVIEGANDFLAQTLDNMNIDATTKITLNAPTVEITDNVDLGDAIGLVLNSAASMQVNIPTGSSAGTYPVTIVNAGQTKVNA